MVAHKKKGRYEAYCSVFCYLLFESFSEHKLSIMQCEQLQYAVDTLMNTAYTHHNHVIHARFLGHQIVPCSCQSKKYISVTNANPPPSHYPANLDEKHHNLKRRVSQTAKPTVRQVTMLESILYRDERIYNGHIRKTATMLSCEGQREKLPEFKSYYWPVITMSCLHRQVSAIWEVLRIGICGHSVGLNLWPQ